MIYLSHQKVKRCLCEKSNQDNWYYSFCILILVAIGVGILIYSAQKSAESYAADQAQMSKSDEELLGVQFDVPQNGKDAVDVNLYLPAEGDNLPVVFNLHGGAFIGGDADTLDTQSDRISKNWNVIVVTVNYSLAKDGITIEDGTQEVVDVIQYFKQNAEQYRADPDRFCVMGYSAGGYHAMSAVLELKAQNIDVAAQVLCYPYLGGALETYNKLSQEQQNSIAPALFVLADNDPIGDGSLPYRDALEENGVHTELKQYSGAIHGFIEENNPEYEKLNNKPSKSPEQESMAREAEELIGTWLYEQFDS